MNKGRHSRVSWNQKSGGRGSTVTLCWTVLAMYWNHCFEFVGVCHQAYCGCKFTNMRLSFPSSQQHAYGELCVLCSVVTAWKLSLRIVVCAIPTYRTRAVFVFLQETVGEILQIPCAIFLVCYWLGRQILLSIDRRGQVGWRFSLAWLPGLQVRIHVYVRVIGEDVLPQDGWRSWQIKIKVVAWITNCQEIQGRLTFRHTMICHVVQMQSHTLSWIWLHYWSTPDDHKHLWRSARTTNLLCFE